MGSNMRMRDLIKVIRACKTAAEERDAIATESAKIRTSIKSGNNDYRQRNVAKLLYIHMLGYPTHFGAMECLKLIVSPHYSSKRLGYLALMLLLDENAEVLMLVTNSLKTDLFHPNQFVVALALCALGNIASAEMARDCAPEIDKLLQSTNSYIRKKAALCAVKIIRKEPELAENFVPRVRALLAERNHGVLLTGVTLLDELLQRAGPNLDVTELRTTTPSLVRLLKGLVTSGYAPEHDVGGITDPFLQVRLLRVLRLLGKGDQAASEQMSDILAQIATNTETVRNVGNAILYECVQTVMTIESEQGLKVLAVNVLGRFLLNRDNNIRYVALNTLSKVVNLDFQAVQRHRDTIVDCLRDPDVSIRRRSLDLLLGLVNETNVKTLVRELLNFLLVSDVEFRADLVERLCLLIGKYAPSTKWQLDTTLRVMAIAGNNYLPDDVPATLIALVSQHADLQQYACTKLYGALLADMSSQALAQVAVWVIGEYGDQLVGQPYTQSSDNVEEGADTVSTTPVSAAMIVDSLADLLRAQETSTLTRKYALNALGKLGDRLDNSVQDKIQGLLTQYSTNIIVDLQQRSVEYLNILNKVPQHKRSILAHVPALERTLAGKLEMEAVPAPATGGGAAKSGGSLLDLDDIFTGGGPSAGGAAPAPASLDPLADLLGPSPAAPASSSNPMDDLLGLGGPVKPAAAPVAAAAVPAATNLVVYDKNGIRVNFDIRKNAAQPHLTLVNASAVNTGLNDITEFSLLAAVPQYLKLLLEAPSGTHLAPMGAPINLVIKLNNSLHGQKPILMKLKLSYVANGHRAEDLADVSFPANL